MSLRRCALSFHLTLSILLVLSPLVLSSCPDNCGRHGNCINDACECDKNYAGVDCSIVDYSLVSGEAATDSVPKYHWHYLHIEYPAGTQTLNVRINQTSIGDCDVYGRSDEYPTKTEHQYKDIGEDAFQSWDVSVSGQGVYYIGLYGYLTCRATVVATVSGNSCPQQCSGHGACLENGHCDCDEGYFSDDCSIAGIRLHKDAPYGSHVKKSHGDYYLIMVDHRYNEIIVRYNGTDDSEDYCSTFISYGHPPNKTSYDLITLAEERQNYYSVISEPRMGPYYVFIYAHHDQSCDYAISFTTAEHCVSKCSKHGKCRSGSTCKCDDAFQGDYCQEMIPPLAWGTAVNGFVDSDQWNYYHVVTDTASNLVISVDQTADEYDCDIYVQAGSNPSFFSYDYNDISVKSSFNVTIEDPGDFTWYIGVYGFLGECDYSIAATISSSSCANNCIHGNCEGERCHCDDGWTGDDCASELKQIRSGEVVNATVKPEEYKYFEVKHVKGHLYVYVRELYTSATLRVFASEGTFPTKRNHDYKGDNHNHNQNHNIEIHTETTESATYFIGVRADIGDEHDEYPFSISVWAPTVQ